MNTELINNLNDYIKVRLTEKRYQHTIGVIDTAVALSEKYGEDREKTYIAALFHDACKNLDIDEMNMLTEEYGIGEVYIDKPQLAHSKLAAVIIKDRFGVEDEDIINAISYHTTGRAGMSQLEKIIYIADATEPNRTYSDAKRINALAFEDLDRACFEVSEWSLEAVREAGKYLDSDTVRARNWFESRLKGAAMDSSINLAIFAARIIDEKKGSDIVILDIAEKSSFADYFVIATGNSERQIEAIADEIEDRAAQEGKFMKSVEGKNGSGWILMDMGDVIVNIFLEDKREKYNLEKIWSDCSCVDWEV